MIGYRNYNALITHKGEIIKQLTKDYMLDYHLPYLDALKNAVREFDIKAEVLSASFKKAKKITSKSQAEYSKKAGSTQNKRWRTIIDPFTQKMYSCVLDLLRSYGAEKHYQGFLGRLKRLGSVKKAMLAIDVIARKYPNEEPTTSYYARNVRYKGVTDHKGKKFRDLKVLCEYYGVSYTKFYRWFAHKGYPIATLTQMIENKTFNDLGK